jgi:threonine dehydratase
VTDRPGGIARLSAVIASVGASVLEITHDRTFAGPDVFSARVAVTVETADRAQIDTLSTALAAAGFPLAQG